MTLVFSYTDLLISVSPHKTLRREKEKMIEREDGEICDFCFVIRGFSAVDLSFR